MPRPRCCSAPSPSAHSRRLRRSQVRRTARETVLIARARGIHQRVITIDTHVDINPTNFTQLSRNYANDVGTQVNLPKMRTGGLDAPFLIVYVGQSNPQTTPDAFEADGYQRAYDLAIEKFEAIHRLTKVLAPDQIGLALTAADVRRIVAQGKEGRAHRRRERLSPR